MSWKSPFPESTVTGEYGTLSEFRRARGMQPHSGRDFAPGANKVIPAVAAGTVRLIQWSNVLGWVLVQSARGVDGKTYFIGYSHLACDKHGINCKGPKVQGEHSPFKETKEGDKKGLGDPIGKVGNTGSGTSGAHLHLTVSATLKGVFGVTSAKLDPKTIIQANAKGAAPKQADPKAKAVVEKVAPASVIYACPHCKKELK